ncbi:hypothetical protein PUR71_08060 [Streptomyces sp. SP17BM10]|uniref:hypothetical protein n=1 Tax=Streptomyces sp. SP17BM10 TaxID=3002530 RepID=UPI002E7631D8|nr:hypothetical protein [Streptomyces sp. SP17BM10]MEE1782869.1 hypothetical protein [Streptomyces sp. SP17BM10]
MAFDVVIPSVRDVYSYQTTPLATNTDSPTEHATVRPTISAGDRRPAALPVTRPPLRL